MFKITPGTVVTVSAARIPNMRHPDPAVSIGKHHLKSNTNLNHNPNSNPDTYLNFITNPKPHFLLRCGCCG